jgi:hypothetical protein
MGKPEGKRPLGRPRHRWEDGIKIDLKEIGWGSVWEDGIKMDLKEIGWGSVDWIQLVQDSYRWRAFVNTMMNLWVLAPRS